MHYVSTYTSPIGEMLIAADEVGIVGLWFVGAKHYAVGLDKKAYLLKPETISYANSLSRTSFG